jgi:hypothetical protein
MTGHSWIPNGAQSAGAQKSSQLLRPVALSIFDVQSVRIFGAFLNVEACCGCAVRGQFTQMPRRLVGTAQVNKTERS